MNKRDAMECCQETAYQILRLYHNNVDFKEMFDYTYISKDPMDSYPVMSIINAFAWWNVKQTERFKDERRKLK